MIKVINGNNHYEQMRGVMIIINLLYLEERTELANNASICENRQQYTL